MKKRVTVLSLFASIILLSVSVSAVCVVPITDMIVTQNTTFCSGTFNVNNIQLSNHGITISCNDTILRGNFEFQGFYSEYHDITIKDCTLIRQKNAIVLKGGLGYKIINNKIVNTLATAIEVAFSENGLIKNNSIDDSGVAIVLFRSHNFSVDSNTLVNTLSRPIDLTRATNNFILNNNISHTIYSGAIRLQDNSNYNLILNNRIFDTATEGGVTSVDSPNNKIIENQIVNSGGIIIDSIRTASHHNSVISNFINGSIGNGIVLPDFGTDNNVTLNTIIGTTTGSIFVKGVNNTIWNNNLYDDIVLNFPEEFNVFCVNGIGNKYFDGAIGPICLDEDNDGVGNEFDLCSNTPEGEDVNEDGCSCSQIDLTFRDCPIDQCIGENFVDYPDDNFDICLNGEIIEIYSCETLSSIYDPQCDSDDDNDGIPDEKDNCPVEINPKQNDSDNDRVGDACDSQTCNNNIKEIPEDCDGSDLAGGTCIDFGFNSGNLECSDMCTFDATKCVLEQKFLRGDANTDGIVDLSDAIRTFGWLFQGAAEPNCLDTADSNDDGAIDLSDGVYTLNFLFLNKSIIKEPYPNIGIDPTNDNINCKSYKPSQGAVASLTIEEALKDPTINRRIKNVLKSYL